MQKTREGGNPIGKRIASVVGLELEYGAYAVERVDDGTCTSGQEPLHLMGISRPLHINLPSFSLTKVGVEGDDSHNTWSGGLSLPQESTSLDPPRMFENQLSQTEMLESLSQNATSKEEKQIEKPHGLVSRGEEKIRFNDDVQRQVVPKQHPIKKGEDPREKAIKQRLLKRNGTKFNDDVYIEIREELKLHPQIRRKNYETPEKYLGAVEAYVMEKRFQLPDRPAPIKRIMELAKSKKKDSEKLTQLQDAYIKFEAYNDFNTNKHTRRLVAEELKANGTVAYYYPTLSLIEKHQKRLQIMFQPNQMGLPPSKKLILLQKATGGVCWHGGYLLYCEIVNDCLEKKSRLLQLGDSIFYAVIIGVEDGHAIIYIKDAQDQYWLLDWLNIKKPWEESLTNYLWKERIGPFQSYKNISKHIQKIMGKQYSEHIVYHFTNTETHSIVNMTKIENQLKEEVEKQHPSLGNAITSIQHDV